jgi:hypothetical protein
MRFYYSDERAMKTAKHEDEKKSMDHGKWEKQV